MNRASAATDFLAAFGVAMVIFLPVALWWFGLIHEFMIWVGLR